MLGDCLLVSFRRIVSKDIIQPLVLFLRDESVPYKYTYWGQGGVGPDSLGSRLPVHICGHASMHNNTLLPTEKASYMVKA